VTRGISTWRRGRGSAGASWSSGPVRQREREREGWDACSQPRSESPLMRVPTWLRVDRATRRAHFYASLPSRPPPSPTSTTPTFSHTPSRTYSLTRLPTHCTVERASCGCKSCESQSRGMALERCTNPKLSRRACTCEYGATNISRGIGGRRETAARAHLPPEITTRFDFLTFVHRCVYSGAPARRARVVASRRHEAADRARGAAAGLHLPARLPHAVLHSQRPELARGSIPSNASCAFTLSPLFGVVRGHVVGMSVQRLPPSAKSPKSRCETRTLRAEVGAAFRWAVGSGCVRQANFQGLLGSYQFYEHMVSVSLLSLEVRYGNYNAWTP
jgi:hypothetical protein